MNERKKRTVPFAAECMLLVALAALVRGPCLSAELWLDEVWSWEFARAVQTPWQIFTGPEHHHDNNHKLNTLYLYFIPDGLPFAFYRLHSFAAGLAAVLLAFRAAGRRGRLEAIFAALLVAVNYWFVLCSAEARGYALALAFALAAFDGLQRYLRDGGMSYLTQFWFAVILGFLAHLTFLHVYLALAVWTVYHCARNRATKGGELAQLLRIHAFPASFFVLLYLADVRRMTLGGGPSLPVYVVLGRLLNFSLGLSFAPLFLVCVAGICQLRRQADDSWVFFLMAVVGAPLMLLLASPPFVYERYFFIPLLFFLMLLSYLLADLARCSWTGKIAAAVVLVLICVGNLGGIAEFVLEGGRGRFAEALCYIEAQSDGGDIRIASDSDERVPKMLAFYAPYADTQRRLVYVNSQDAAQHPADWMLIERPDRNLPPVEEFTFPDANGATYRQAEAFRVTAFGGWDWYAYRRVVGTP